MGILLVAVVCHWHRCHRPGLLSHQRPTAQAGGRADELADRRTLRTKTVRKSTSTSGTLAESASDPRSTPKRPLQCCHCRRAVVTARFAHEVIRSRQLPPPEALQAVPNYIAPPSHTYRPRARRDGLPERYAQDYAHRASTNAVSYDEHGAHADPRPAPSTASPGAQRDHVRTRRSPTPDVALCSRIAPFENSYRTLPLPSFPPVPLGSKGKTHAQERRGELAGRSRTAHTARRCGNGRSIGGATCMSRAPQTQIAAELQNTGRCGVEGRNARVSGGIVGDSSSSFFRRSIRCKNIHTRTQRSGCQQQ